MSASLAKKFPFKEVIPSELVPGNQYYFMVKKDLAKKTREGKVRKLSGIFVSLETALDIYSRPREYAVFTNVMIIDKKAKMLPYNSGKIMAPYFNAANIAKPSPLNKGLGTRKAKDPGHQNLNIKTFSQKEWLFDTRNWIFGESSMESILAESVLREKTGKDLGIILSSYLTKEKNARKTRKNRKNH